MANLSRLTTRAAANTADYTGLREFRTRGHRDDNFGDILSITKTPIALSEKIGVREDDIAHNFFRSVVRFSPVLS